MKTACLSALCTLAVLASARAEDSYVLAKADYLPPAGTKAIQSQKMALKDGTVKLAMAGTKMDGTCEMTETEVDAIEIVSASKIKMKITAGEKSQTMKIAGEDHSEPASPVLLLDVPLTFTKADGKWTAAVDGGAELSDEQKEEVTKKEKSLNKSEDVAMYGTTARKVGDTWTVDAADLPFSEGDKETKGEVKLTFKGIETYEGKKCAHITGPMDITGKTDDEEAKDMSLKGTVDIMRSIDDLTDLKMEFTGKMAMKGEIPNGTMEMGGNMTMSKTAKVTH